MIKKILKMGNCRVKQAFSDKKALCNQLKFCEMLISSNSNIIKKANLNIITYAFYGNRKVDGQMYIWRYNDFNLLQIESIGRNRLLLRSLLLNEYGDVTVGFLTDFFVPRHSF